MAFKSTGKKSFGGRSFKKGAGKEERHEEKKEYTHKGGGYHKKGGGDGDSEFIHITGLFESTSGKSFTVFLKPEILEKLADLGEDDLLGVSEAKYGMSLWVKKADK